MSDASEPDTDAWARACAEDLAAERDRRRSERASTPGSAASELGRLVDSVADRLAEFAAPLAGAAGETAGRRAAESATEQWTRSLAEGAKSVLGPLAQRNPQVLDHLTAAGSELVSAYRAAVESQEQRWTRPDSEPGTSAADSATDTQEVTVTREPEDGGDGRPRQDSPGSDASQNATGDEDDDGPPHTERIDLD